MGNSKLRVGNSTKVWEPKSGLLRQEKHRSVGLTRRLHGRTDLSGGGCWKTFQVARIPWMQTISLMCLGRDERE